uniref:Uncharacterized protein n=1 Tax=Anopheles atroparvus TaxID=41427 RepID=A0A182JDW9_ANOAO
MTPTPPERTRSVDCSVPEVEVNITTIFPKPSDFRIEEGGIELRIVRWVGADVLQLLDHVLRRWGFHRQMGALRLEPVLVGHVRQGNVRAVRCREKSPDERMPSELLACARIPLLVSYTKLYEPSSLMTWSCCTTTASLSGPPAAARAVFFGGAAATQQTTPTRITCKTDGTYSGAAWLPGLALTPEELGLFFGQTAAGSTGNENREMPLLLPTPQAQSVESMTMTMMALRRHMRLARIPSVRGVVRFSRDPSLLID